MVPCSGQFLLYINAARAWKRHVGTSTLPTFRQTVGSTMVILASSIIQLACILRSALQVKLCRYACASLLHLNA